MKKYLLLWMLFLVFSLTSAAQQKSFYADLPVGKYAVGFKIITLIDDARVSTPEYNYLGEKNEGDRQKRITIHIWYPAIANPGKGHLQFKDYCYNNLLRSTFEKVDTTETAAQVTRRRNSMVNWFGSVSDDAWKQLLETPMLAQAEAVEVKQKFPLLIGMLRPLSTSITNELLASHGYVVAMVKSDIIGSFAQAALSDIPDMQYAMSRLGKDQNIDTKNIGTFGFSGSGFVQVLLAMYDYRIKALADLESGLYMDGLFQGLSASNYYNTSKLRVPFLHIFSLDLSKQEKFIDEFESKTKFSKRYRLLLNQQALHHWDFAAEGYAACTILKNRGADQINIKRSFEISNIYLLNFFNAELKKDTYSVNFLSSKPSLPGMPSSLWDIATLGSVKPSPDKDEFEYIIRKKGINEALAIVSSSLKTDSSTNLLQGFVLNNLGYTFLGEKKYEEAIGVFKLNTELHPQEANFFDSLAEGYETSGDTENMKKTSAIVLELLSKKTSLTNAERSLKEFAERRSK